MVSKCQVVDVQFDIFQTFRNRKEKGREAFQYLMFPPSLPSGGSRTIKTLADIESFRKLTGASSVMVARAAEWNCSVFRKEGPLPYTEVMHSYLKIVSQGL